MSGEDNAEYVGPFCTTFVGARAREFRDDLLSLVIRAKEAGVTVSALAPVAPGCEAKVEARESADPYVRIGTLREALSDLADRAEAMSGVAERRYTDGAGFRLQTAVDRARRVLALPLAGPAFLPPPSPRAESRDAAREVRWTEANALTVANEIAQAVHLKWNGRGLSLRPVNMGRDDLPWDPRPDIAAMALRALLGEARAAK